MTISETMKEAVKKFDEHPEALITLLFTTLFGYFGMGAILMLMSKVIRHRLAGFFMEAWGVYLLGALGVLLPGIYTFVHALKVNIAVTASRTSGQFYSNQSFFG